MIFSSELLVNFSREEHSASLAIGIQVNIGVHSKIKDHNADLIDAPSSTLQNDNLQQLGSVTFCIFTSIYSQHLQKDQQLSHLHTAAEMDLEIEAQHDGTAKPFCTCYRSLPSVWSWTGAFPYQSLHSCAREASYLQNKDKAFINVTVF